MNVTELHRLANKMAQDDPRNEIVALSIVVRDYNSGELTHYTNDGCDGFKKTNINY